MSRSRSNWAIDSSAALIELSPDSQVPVYQQIVASLSRAIVGGVLTQGARLPSSRELAQTLGVARNTVNFAYQELSAQGFISSRTGSGTYVSADLDERLLQAPSVSASSEHSTASRRLSARGIDLAAHPISRVRQEGPVRPFRAGVPAIDSAATEAWLRESAAVWRNHRLQSLNYDDPQGNLQLRSTIAQWLGATRGVKCDVDQVVIVSGSQQGLYLAAAALLDRNESIWLEDPARTAARAVFSALGQNIIPIPIDADGLDVEAGIALAPRAAAAYVSPSSQFPMNVQLSVSRRLRLIEWATRNDAWIFEDDYQSHHRYSGRPLPSLHGLEGGNRTVYIGTFSQSLFPSLRLGYLVLPRHLASQIAQARQVLDRQSSRADQLTLMQFMQNGHFDRHVRRMRRHYMLQQEALVDAAATHLKGLIRVEPTSTGMHVLGHLEVEATPDAVEAEALARSVDVTSLTKFTMENQLPPALVMGFGPGTPEEIRASIKRLATAVVRAENLGRQKWTS